MFRSQDHSQGATLLLAKVTVLKTISRNITHDTHPQSGTFSASTTYTMRHAATAPS